MYIPRFSSLEPRKQPHKKQWNYIGRSRDNIAALPEDYFKVLVQDRRRMWYCKHSLDKYAHNSNTRH